MAEDPVSRPGILAFRLDLVLRHGSLPLPEGGDFPLIPKITFCSNQNKRGRGAIFNPMDDDDDDGDDDDDDGDDADADDDNDDDHSDGDDDDEDDDEDNDDDDEMDG